MAGPKDASDRFRSSIKPMKRKGGKSGAAVLIVEQRRTKNLQARYERALISHFLVAGIERQSNLS